MEKTNKNVMGLTVGLFLCLVHLLWIILIGVGAAKVLLDKILSMHCLEISYIITALSWKKAVGLLAFTFVVGYVIGWALVAFYNLLNKKKA